MWWFVAGPRRPWVRSSTDQRVVVYVLAEPYFVYFEEVSFNRMVYVLAELYFVEFVEGSFTRAQLSWQQPHTPLHKRGNTKQCKQNRNAMQ